ncbi:class I SAM-dependent methyltransferase [Candidatus Kaiserbacteria bacterium]|nr:class I SAM-dependent methyltransferase [Candidatus Kaiserbacteria bacterium]
MSYTTVILTTKIYTRGGISRENIFQEKKVLDIGCGQRKLSGAVGLDVLENSQADIIHDVSKTPWPFEDNSFDVVFANHHLEHVSEPLVFLREAHRILRPKGRIVLQVPYFRFIDAFTDPTHRHFFTSQSLDYVIDGTKLAKYQYTNFRFREIGFWYGWPIASHNPFVRLFKWYIHRHPRFYDQYLSLFFPVPCLTWELEVIK